MASREDNENLEALASLSSMGLISLRLLWNISISIVLSMQIGEQFSVPAVVLRVDYPGRLRGRHSLLVSSRPHFVRIAHWKKWRSGAMPESSFWWVVLLQHERLYRQKLFFPVTAWVNKDFLYCHQRGVQPQSSLWINFDSGEVYHFRDRM